MIQILLWAPFAAALGAALFPSRVCGWIAALGSLISLVLAILITVEFDPGGGLQHTVDVSWIPDLGVRYQLGVDGISLFLVVLTSVLWLAATVWSTINPPERRRTWFLMLGLAETATLGAFLAQDLILFVLFFDLMLIPFYFLFGIWGTEHPGRAVEGEGPVRPQPAVIKMIIYTLVGSLLMLAGAIATGILAADGGELTYSMAALRENPLGTGSQYWIFWFFAAAFL
ncbi:MAG TPA: proton-conducting transporter membrane subunit, partial [Solirubrobacterales bacterium]|nr:proton-conducting transporter membrane subunit [Solirubrobacterales bacterium]